ncbi:MAG: outer membrane beta-barrel protein [Bacteroidia bacterium]
MARLKMIFINGLILCFFIPLKAQNFKAQLLGGMNVAQVDGDSYSGYNQPGILAGVTIYRQGNKKRDFGFGLIYSQKGSHKKTTEESPDIFKLRYTYLCMPLFVDINLKNPDFKKITFRAAISPNLNIASKQSFGYGWNTTSIRKYEISGILGVRYKFNEKLGGIIQIENSVLSIGAPVLKSLYYNQNSRGLYNRMASFVVSYDLR